ncbi:hypothetical protein BV25DRAFT_1365155 [Artomyces pyxidatus]|uniref:Uncharacterized protein n=1 Tax=Artomyces pyxidatus TaxID=48021 RepID=A0ACB8SMY8_9AGAM|nr:hypothetical protein BV25DRAFT_1365155 [Artomyces pyxidatus]
MTPVDSTVINVALRRCIRELGHETSNGDLQGTHRRPLLHVSQARNPASWSRRDRVQQLPTSADRTQALRFLQGRGILVQHASARTGRNTVGIHRSVKVMWGMEHLQCIHAAAQKTMLLTPQNRSERYACITHIDVDGRHPDPMASAAASAMMFSPRMYDVHCAPLSQIRAQLEAIFDEAESSGMTRGMTMRI